MPLFVSIKKTFGAFKLDVDLEAGDGAATGILGASGSGKSLTLRCIAGLHTPDEGRIALDGEVLFDSRLKINLPPQKRRVGYMFQSYALFPNMTVEQNIGAGAPGRGAEKKRLVAGHIRSFYLEGLERRYPAQLSGGQGQRVALARMLASKPRVILMDEPLSSVDGHLRWQLEKGLQDILAGFGGPSLVVSHDCGELYRLCRRVAVLEGGRVDSCGEKEGLYERPSTLAGARLIGCKNISRARKLSEHEVEALDWREVLTTAAPVRPDILYVGVQARAFREAGEEKHNTIKCVIDKIVDNVNNEIILARPAGVTPPNEEASIYWESPKNRRKRQVGETLRLSVEAGDILQLGP